MGSEDRRDKEVEIRAGASHRSRRQQVYADRPSTCACVEPRRGTTARSSLPLFVLTLLWREALWRWPTRMADRARRLWGHASSKARVTRSSSPSQRGPATGTGIRTAATATQVQRSRECHGPAEATHGRRARDGLKTVPYRD